MAQSFGTQNAGFEHFHFIIQATDDNRLNSKMNGVRGVSLHFFIEKRDRLSPAGMYIIYDRVEQGTSYNVYDM